MLQYQVIYQKLFYYSFFPRNQGRSLPNPVRPMMLMLMPVTVILNSLGSLLNVVIFVVRIPVTASAVPIPVSVFDAVAVMVVSPLVNVLVVPLAVTMLGAAAAIVVVFPLQLVLGLLLGSLVLKFPPLCRSALLA